MRRNRKGITFGTVFMLIMTVAILLCTVYLLFHLTGGIPAKLQPAV